MNDYSLSEARAALPELLNRVAAGEEITITRHGAPAAVLIAHDRWVKTKTHDVLIEAQKLRLMLRSARFEDFVPIEGYDAEAHIAELDDDRDYPWPEE